MSLFLRSDGAIDLTFLRPDAAIDSPNLIKFFQHVLAADQVSTLEVDSDALPGDGYLDAEELAAFQQVLGGYEDFSHRLRWLMLKRLDPEQRVAAPTLERVVGFLEAYNEGLRRAQLSNSQDFSLLKSGTNFVACVPYFFFGSPDKTQGESACFYGDNLATRQIEEEYKARLGDIHLFKRMMSEAILNREPWALQFEGEAMVTHLSSWIPDSRLTHHLRLLDLVKILTMQDPVARHQALLDLALSELADGNDNIETKFYNLSGAFYNNYFARSLLVKLGEEGMTPVIREAAHAHFMASKGQGGNLYNGLWSVLTLSDAPAWAAEEKQKVGNQLFEFGMWLGPIPKSIKGSFRGVKWAAKWGLQRVGRLVPGAKRFVPNFIAKRFSQVKTPVSVVAPQKPHWFRNAVGVGMAGVATYANSPEYDVEARASRLPSTLDVQDIFLNPLMVEFPELLALAPWSEQLHQVDKIQVLFSPALTVKPQQAMLLACEDEYCEDPEPIVRLGPQRFECDTAGCYGILKSGHDYLRLQMTMPDGNVVSTGVLVWEQGYLDKSDGRRRIFHVDLSTSDEE